VLDHANNNIRDMEFDVVIGNPPYQNGKTKSMRDAIWPKFTDLSLNLVKDSGIISLIVPPQWIHNKYWKVLSKLDIKFINYKECKKHFPSTAMNQHFSYFILKNDEYEGKTTIKSVDSVFDKTFIEDFDLREIKIPTGVVPIKKELFSILNTIEKHEKFNIIRGNTISNNKGPYSKTKSEVFKYKTWYSTKQTLWASEPIKGYNKNKVIVNYTSYYYKSFDKKDLDYHMPILKNVGVGLQGAFIETETPEKLRITLNRELYRFLSHVHRSGAYWAALDKFPKVDDSKEWSDEELYDYFKFKPEQVAYIKKVLKDVEK
jgi:hypothetical protein